MARFKKIDTAKGPAFFEETGAGLSAVTDSETLNKLRSGEISFDEEEQIAGGARRFAPDIQDSSSPPPEPDIPDQSQSEPQGGQSDFSIPDATGSSSNELLEFANILSSATELARKKRNEQGLGVLQDFVPEGAVPASDFGSVLSNLNRAGSQFASNLTSQALDIEESQRSQKRDLAIDAINAGATRDQIQSILNAESDEQALGATAAVMNEVTSDDFSFFSTSDGLAKVNQDTGEVEFVSGSGGGTGGRPQTQVNPADREGDDGISVPGSSISPEAKQVIDGFKGIDDFTPSKQDAVENELFELGFGSENPPQWFRDVIQEERQQNVTPEFLRNEWQKIRSRVLGEQVTGGDTTVDTTNLPPEIQQLVQDFPDHKDLIVQMHKAELEPELIRQKIGNALRSL